MESRKVAFSFLLFRPRPEQIYYGEHVRAHLTNNLNQFVPNAPFLYPMKTLEQVFWYFQGVEKGCIRNKWANWYIPATLKYKEFSKNPGRWLKNTKSQIIEIINNECRNWENA